MTVEQLPGSKASTCKEQAEEQHGQETVPTVQPENTAKDSICHSVAARSFGKSASHRRDKPTEQHSQASFFWSSAGMQPLEASRAGRGPAAPRWTGEPLEKLIGTLIAVH